MLSELNTLETVLIMQVVFSGKIDYITHEQCSHFSVSGICLNLCIAFTGLSFCVSYEYSRKIYMKRELGGFYSQPILSEGFFFEGGVSSLNEL